MSGTIMMYVLPMMLGQTYDMGSDRPGIQIFNDSTFEHVEEIQHYFTDSRYHMVDNTQDVRDFLDVKGKLSLKIKAGLIDLNGEGSYLKDSGTKSNSVEILIKVHFETITKTIPSFWKPNTNWMLQNKKFLGTHYCRSITYGGDLLATVIFTTKNAFDNEVIKGALRTSLNVKGINAGLQAHLEMITDKLDDTTSMEIKYYATVPLAGVSYTIEGLMKEVEQFPERVKKVNNGIGNALRMELFPLSSLESIFPTYHENSAINNQLEDLEDQFDDIRTTRKEIMNWVSSLPPTVPKTLQNKIEKFMDKIEKIFSVYVETISELDLLVSDSAKPFAKAFDAYRDGSFLFPDKYMREFKLLQKEIYKEFLEFKPAYGGASYIRWGMDSCGSKEDVETVISGISIASIPTTSGSSEFICSPTEPDLKNPQDYFENYDSNNIEFRNILGPIIYKEHNDSVGENLPCSICRVKRRASTLALQALKNCPNEWNKEYQGELMASKSTGPIGDYICVDENSIGISNNSYSNINDNGIEINKVTVLCGVLPCNSYVKEKPVSCVICTK